ncbi:class A beta-lactamase [Iningainema tapete]|uniref:Class A beta-lactamase n=1 Tax=Iningainema tapete BLCC-T55 TaxID=2748662 RepID=A0A8J6XQL7_9CYAN|nr:class A beta-lactamase [Iningainema tapete]MBD2776455.1 class A beta-lactamase [Iningainema tapete BLCC-T55]
MFSIFVRRFWLLFAVVTLLTLMLLPVKAQQPSPTSNTAILQSRLNNLNLNTVNGKVGIGVLNLNTGESGFINGKQRFPMQSVYKLPSAIAVLKLVDEGKISLEQAVTITPQEFALGSSPIKKEIKGNSAQFTVQYLLNLSVGISDNTAADALVRLVGGTQQVNVILGKLKIRDVRVDRLEQQLQPESVGMTNFRPELADEKKFAAAEQKIPARVKKAALEKYLRDPRDTATPEGIVDMLQKLQSNKLLSQNSTALLLKIMTDSPTGQKRLKAGLPKNWSIAHKTGTGADVLGRNTATNDVGIISSPEGTKVALAVFIAGSQAALNVREQLMSNIASVVVEAMQ